MNYYICHKLKTKSWYEYSYSVVGCRIAEGFQLTDKCVCSFLSTLQENVKQILKKYFRNNLKEIYLKNYLHDLVVYNIRKIKISSKMFVTCMNN